MKLIHNQLLEAGWHRLNRIHPYEGDLYEHANWGIHNGAIAFNITQVRTQDYWKKNELIKDMRETVDSMYRKQLYSFMAVVCDHESLAEPGKVFINQLEEGRQPDMELLHYIYDPLLSGSYSERYNQFTSSIQRLSIFETNSQFVGETMEWLRFINKTEATHYNDYFEYYNKLEDCFHCVSAHITGNLMNLKITPDLRGLVEKLLNRDYESRKVLADYLEEHNCVIEATHLRTENHCHLCFVPFRLISRIELEI